MGYLPEYYPLMFGGYPSHRHYSPYLDEAESVYEMFQFAYSGQWWHMGALWAKVLTMLVPVFLIWRIYNSEDEKKSRGLTFLRNNKLGEGYSRGELYRIEY